MRVPLSWLKECVNITIAPEELGHRLTMAGLEVAAIHKIGLEGAELAWDRQKIVIGNVLEVKPHPNADLLVLADVDYGAATPHTVVTGAPNLFVYKGQGPLAHPFKSVIAFEGAQLYDGHREERLIVTLKGRPVRGVLSNAMLCSEKELGLSDEHEGIIRLEDDAPVGMPACELLGEVVFEIDLTPNLARCLSIIGIAREVAALTGETFTLPEPQALMTGTPIEGRVQVTIEADDLCPRFTAGLIEGITIQPSPHWMQRRLRYAGMRPVNNMVDISNYVMLEWGQPTHAFDADCVSDQHLIVRLARAGERLTTLDDKERDLQNVSTTPLLVCDLQGPLALAGIMGGASSEVRETTTRVLLEAAIWKPSQVRRSAQEFKLPSEASRRFERGVDYALPWPAQHRALELMRTLGGGTIVQGLVDVYPHRWEPLVLQLPPAEVERIVGVRLSAHEIAQLLQSLGFVCKVQGSGGMGDLSTVMGGQLDVSTVMVEVPSFRQDVTLLADLCEEIARVYGYDRIPETRLMDELPAADRHPERELEQRSRDVLVGCGLSEVITYALTDMAAVARLSPAEAQSSRYLRLSNAVSPEREYMRRSLLPSLVEALATNLKEQQRVGLFEIGRVFLPNDDDTWLPDELLCLGLALAGTRHPPTWKDQSGGASTEAMLDFFDLKGIVETLLKRLMIHEALAWVALNDDERFHPGRSAMLMRGSGEEQQKVGVVGELHPLVLERFHVDVPRAVVAELQLDTLMALAQQPIYTAISRYPATVQDLAVVVANDVPAERVVGLIRQGAGALLESVSLFDIYSGPQIGAGKRSLAYRLAFRASDRTLTDEALTKVRNKVIKLLEREIGASIR
ncbi:MAG: phenylalanine--tRNA ligase subunit beta [Chloroflexaceae bacterium]|nr:phenylalanine--tRNA ligase subunit beta [Chloroflexaceae bacterium]